MWATISDASKALEAAKMAFDMDIYRPYEIKKREENGEVFT
jgi:hypothetical protein